MQGPLTFSIGIPAFKGRFLKECIDSVLAQTYTNFELIIINDCSPEPLDEIIYAYSDTRISYYKNPKNIGAEYVIQNWNKCLNKSSGKYFILLGDDDMMEPGYLEAFVELINTSPDLDVYHCRSKIIDETSTPFTLTPSWPEFESVYENIWHRINNGKRQQFISDFVYRTEYLKNKGGFYNLPLAWGSDDLTAYLACGTKGIAHTNKPVFKYRKNSINISSTGSPAGKMKAIGLEHQWFVEFLKTPPTSELDLLLFEEIKKMVGKHIQRKRIQVISASLKADFWKNAGNWMYYSRKYNTSYKEVLYAIMVRLLHDLRLQRPKKTYAQ